MIEIIFQDILVSENGQRRLVPQLVHESKNPCVSTPKKEKIKILERGIFSLKKKYKNTVTSKPPTGAKNKECVKFLWYSTESNGSTADLIKISESGNNPPTAPKKLANLIFFFSAKEEDKLAPNTA